MTTVLMHTLTVVGRAAVYVCRQTECSSSGGGYIDRKAAFCRLLYQWRRFLLNGGGRGRSPQRGPGAQPLVRGSEGHSPPEAEKKLTSDNTKPL